MRMAAVQNGNTFECGYLARQDQQSYMWLVTAFVYRAVCKYAHTFIFWDFGGLILVPLKNNLDGGIRHQESWC